MKRFIRYVEGSKTLGLLKQRTVERRDDGYAIVWAIHFSPGPLRLVPERIQVPTLLKLERVEELVAAVNDENIAAVLCGHLHTFIDLTTTSGDIPQLRTGSASCYQEANIELETGFQFITITVNGGQVNRVRAERIEYSPYAGFIDAPVTS